MLRFSANLSMLFGEYDFLTCFEKTTQCDFRGVEFMFPCDYDIEELRQVLANNKLEYTLYNLPAGDWAVGERGIICIPDREEEFRDGAIVAVRYTRALGSKKVSCLVGRTLTSFSNEQIHTTLVENLCYAANMLTKEDILLLIEPISHFNIPGFHLTGTRQVLKLIGDVGCCSLKVQYDIYYIQRMEGELTNAVTRWANRIGYLQIADNPYHDESGTREINYEYLFTAIENSDYNDWADCKYKPQTTAETGLCWMDPYRQNMALFKQCFLGPLS